MTMFRGDIGVDVLVIGGGAAGIAAAYTAAESGKEVMLVEKNGYPGGMATGAYVGTICGLYGRSVETKPTQSVRGFAAEFANRLIKMDQSKPVVGMNGLRFLPYERYSFIRVSENLMSERKLRVLYHASVFGVKMQGRRVIAVDLRTSSGEFRIKPRTVIDTSGFALIAQYCPDFDLLESGDDYQAGAMVFGLSGLQAESDFQVSLHMAKAFEQFTISGLDKNDKSNLSIIPGSFKRGTAYFKLSIPFSIYESPFSISNAEKYARQTIATYIEFLATHTSAFKTAAVSMLAPYIGIRTGPRYRGAKRLTEADVLECRKHKGSAAKGFWPIEYWRPGERVEMDYFPENDYYDIPAGCLKSNEVENLFFAGRHISASERAIASARVIGTCFQMGETAGRLAIDQIIPRR